MDINPDKPPPLPRRSSKEAKAGFALFGSATARYSPLFRGWRRNISVLIVFLLLTGLPFFKLAEGEVEIESSEINREPEEAPLVLQGNSLLGLSSHSNPEREISVKKWVIVTGYSSTEDQCDADPWTTASGSPVQEGIVATNFLPFETKIKIPAIYGEKVFVVKDRMHPRNSYHIDIWFPSRWQALNFGAIITYIEVL